MTAAYDKAMELHPEWNNHRQSIMTLDWAHKVAAFHHLYEMPVGNGTIRPLSDDRRELREELVCEEVKETMEASAAGDVKEVIDGCLDIIYVCIGWMIELGMTAEQIQIAMREIHASNMTKTDNSGKPIFRADGKVLKGENYVRANLEAALGIDFSAPTE
jgi:predicted HAD superfamily Cof-like phosphohydrolase